jgi:hypothetical protein
MRGLYDVSDRGNNKHQGFCRYCTGEGRLDSDRDEDGEDRVENHACRGLGCAVATCDAWRKDGAEFWEI